ncbi:glycosyltransferase family 4 protein [Leptodesmis sp.]|uniref:glycosyltransferase family 4 protein n=1 Tax=Leptodesmis sp. TaxID=3100501 RepID=UPI0040535376
MKYQKTVGFILKRVDCNDGVASHCETLIRGLKAHGWRIVMITGPVFYDSTSITRFETLKSLVEDWIIFEKINPLLPNFSCLLKIYQTIRKHEISLLHAHGYSMLLVARIVQIFTQIRCVATFHPSIHGNDPKLLKEKALQVNHLQYQFYLGLFTPDKFIAYSSEIANFLTQDLRFPESKVSRMLLGIDTDLFRPPTAEERCLARKKLNFQEDELICALVGRLSWNKGHDILIDAVRQLRTEHSITTIRCLFSGSGHEEKQIKEYAFQSAEDQFYFHFMGYTKDLRDIYWAADVFVLPSRKEGFALVVAEAMACGVVPIRTPAGGAEDQIEHGMNGFIFPFDDSETLVSQLKLLANNPQLREHLADQAYKTAHQKFTLGKMINDTIAIYEQVSLKGI